MPIELIQNGSREPKQTNITPTQARRLCQLIDSGPVISLDSNDNITYSETRLSDAMEMLGMDYRLKGGGSKWITEPVVAMLRDWANALEKSNG